MFYAGPRDMFSVLFFTFAFEALLIYSKHKAVQTYTPGTCNNVLPGWQWGQKYSWAGPKALGIPNIFYQQFLLTVVIEKLKNLVS